MQESTLNGKDALRPGARFDRLVEIMARLRAPDGCPWDREQSFATLRRYLLEETYEVLDAIDAEDWDGLAEELGDLLLQPVFLAQMASEQGRFSIADSLDAINTKLVRRHPHIFGDAVARTPDEVKDRWDRIKAEEKREKGMAEGGLLDSVPRSLPALAEGQEIGRKAAGTGFDWPDVNGVLAKLHEELEELRVAREQGDAKHVEEELGDILFVMVNLARKLDIDAEHALRGANAKFRRRFGRLERRLREEGRFGEATLEEMEEQWQRAKQDR